MIGKGSVLVLSTFLIGSAVIRLFTSAGTALAEGNLTAPPEPQGTFSVATQPKGNEIAEVGPLLQELRVREDKVAKLEADLEMRSKALDVAQVEIERRLAALEAAEQRLQATLSRAKTAAEDDLARLTAVYENMKPSEAAELFDTMEPGFAAGFLARMRPDVAAEVFSDLSPEKAYSISAILAGRNANAPTN